MSRVNALLEATESLNNFEEQEDNYSFDDSFSSSVGNDYVLSNSDIEEINSSLNLAADSVNASTKSLVDLQVEEEGGTEEDSWAAAKTYWSSFMLGWGDEMALWSEAIAKGVSTGTNPSEIYGQLRKEYDEEIAEFKRRHPEAYLTADVGGALSTPVNFIPVVGQTTAAARIAAKAPKIAKAAQIAAPVVRGGVESAIYGAGAAEEGQRLEQAKEYGLTGAALTGGVRAGLKVGGFALDKVTSRKIKQNLVDDQGNFTPITLATTGKDQSVSEQILHSLYKSVIAPSFGAQGSFIAQEKRIFANKEKLVDAQKEMLDKAKKQASIKFDLSTNKLKEGIATQREKWKQTEAAYKEASKRKTDPLEAAFKKLQEGKTNNKFFKEAFNQDQNTADGLRFLFRENRFFNSLPAGATADDVEKLVKISDVGDKMKFLDNLWTEKGYSMIKGKTIRIKSGEFETNLMNALNKDPFFLVNVMDVPAFKTKIDTVIGDLVNFKDKNSRIDGDIMASIRAKLGQAASSSGDPQMQRAFKTVQSNIDEIIKKNLTAKQLEAFSKESGNWKNQVILRDAVGEASAISKNGNFDEEDWFKAINKNSEYDKRYQSGPFKKEALDLKKKIEGKQKQHAKIASNAAKNDAKRIEGLLKQEKSRLTAKLGKEKQRVLGESIRRREAQLGSKKQVMDSFSKNSVEGMRLQAIEADLKALKELSSSHNPSWFHSIAANNILAQGVGQVGQLGQKFGIVLGAGAVGGAPGLVGGLVAGKVLSTQPAQKFMAGQTSGQEAMQRMLQSDRTGYTADVLSRSLAKGMLTGE